MPNREIRLAKASNILSKYFGLSTAVDLAAQIPLDTISSPSNRENSVRIANPSEIEGRLIALIIDTTEGIISTPSLIRLLKDQIGESSDIRERFSQLLQINYAGGSDDIDSRDFLGFVVRNAQRNKPTDAAATVNEILGYGDGQGIITNINAQPSNPTKTSPGLSIYAISSPYVSPQQRNINAVTLFLNSIPNVEMQRAIPFVNVEFFFAKGPISEASNRLQTLSLPKFLLGASVVEADSTLESMVSANTVEGSTISSQQATATQPIPEIYSVAGMELFTAPQTLVNANDINAGNEIRSNPILDKFRPLMSLNEFNLSVEASTGLMGFKRGSMSITLHDRSRLPEVAEFVRPDLYGSNEIMIEYGWSHPAGGFSVEENPYGALIDAMRIKEKYMVVNSNFQFDETGQVNIGLDIAMRGASDFDTVLVSSNNEDVGDAIRNIQELSAIIGEFRQRLFSPGIGEQTSEIRGVQILNAAQDALNHPTLTRELNNELKNFRNRLRGRPEAQQLLNALTRLYGTPVNNRRRGDLTAEASSAAQRSLGGPTLVQRLRTSIVSQIKEKIEKLQNTPDPYLIGNIQRDNRSIGFRNVRQPERAEEQRALRELGELTSIRNTAVSLGKLLLSFVGEPLANTGKFDEVQLLFYPFNGYAGKASSLNIANFVVDLQYFVDEWARYRLEHVARSANMSLREFIRFIADTLVDDSAALSYGLVDPDGPLMVATINGTTRSTRAHYETPEFNTRLENVLRSYTPDGSFRMPQIEIYLECLPEKTGIEEGQEEGATNGKTILRLHIFDRLSTSYDTLGSLLASSRTTEIQRLGHVPQIQDGNQGVVVARQSIAAAYLAAAQNLELIEIIPPLDPTSDPPRPTGPDTIYRIIGGPQALKDFTMKSMPYVIYGAANSNVIQASLASQQVPDLATVNILRSFRREESTTPSGENIGGLPMRIIPTQLSLAVRGCPLIQFAQQLFIDFQTGTTVDNIYSVMALEHQFRPGEFMTNMKLAAPESWPTYSSLVSNVGTAIDILRTATQENEGSAE